MLSDADSRLIFELLEASGGSVTISRKTIEQVYLNTTAEYNWGLERIHMPDGSMVVSIVKRVGTAENIPNAD